MQGNLYNYIQIGPKMNGKLKSAQDEGQSAQKHAGSLTLATLVQGHPV